MPVHPEASSPAVSLMAVAPSAATDIATVSGRLGAGFQHRKITFQGEPRDPSRPMLGLAHRVASEVAVGFHCRNSQSSDRDPRSVRIAAAARLA